MNKSTYLYLTVALLGLSAILSACAGFNLGDILRVKTPELIQRMDGVSGTLTLNEAESEYKQWLERTKAAGLEWKNRIDGANQFAGILGQLTMQAWNDAGPMIGGLPVLGPAIPLVTAGLGLFLGRAGLAKHKEASFNEGVKRGAEAAKKS